MTVDKMQGGPGVSVTVPCRRLSVASNASGNSSTSHTSHNSRESGHHVPRVSDMDTHLSPAKILGPPEHHTRSCSFRNRPRPKALEIVTDRPRRNSMPSPSRNLLSVSYDNLHDSRGENGEGGLRRVRSFKTTSKGLVNRGDSFKKKSTNSLISTGSTVTSENGQSHPKDQEQRERAPSSASNESGTALSVESTNAPSYYRVVMLGARGVGKTALAHQFMTSEYICAFDSSTVEENEGLKHVSVLLDGEESTMEFIDPCEDEGKPTDLNADGYVVAYAINDRSTFQSAVDILYHLRHNQGTDRAIIMVANKIDIVRKRKVTAEEGRSVAIQYDCKFAETSAALNHHVDELLVGILSQIRLKLNPHLTISVPVPQVKKAKAKERKQSKGPRGLLSKLFKKSKTTKACDNLYEL